MTRLLFIKMNVRQIPMVPHPPVTLRPTILATFAALFLVGCAGQYDPPGGPVDSTPPVVIRTAPDTDAVHVDTQSLTFEFSKYVRRETLQGSIFISPDVGPLEYDWSGKEVTVHFKEHLRKGTTYVVNVGTDVADVNAGNRMAKAFTLAFSTGDSLDAGVIGGKIFDEKAEGVLLFAYRLDGIVADTLNPSHAKPDFITQSGTAGGFVLSHLPYGLYRLLAVRDEYHNLLYDRQIDEYGVAQEDIGLSASHPRVDSVWFRMAKEATTRPFIAGARVHDRYRLSVRLSEPIDSASFTNAEFTIQDTVTHAGIPILLSSLERIQSTVVTLLLTAPLDSPATYRVWARGISDKAGNRIDSASPGEIFNGSLAADTVRPRISLRDIPRDSTRGVAVDHSLEILFSDPVVHPPLMQAVVLLDSMKHRVDCDQIWTGQASVALVPRTALKGKAWYSAKVAMDSVRSFFGRGYHDSTWVVRFQTIDLRTMGNIAGQVVEEKPGVGKGRVFVSASSIDLTPRRSSTVMLPEPGPFAFPQLVEGKYVVSGFRDSDSSGTYSYGMPFPFAPAERFAVYPDTIRVRARWGVEGVTLHLR